MNARDRIGKGPWRNAKGEVIAKDVADLHGAANGLTKQTALTEKGAVVNGRGDTPNMHDILTGSQADGTAFPAGDDITCSNWTERRRRRGHARACRPHRARRRAADEVLEHVPPLPRRLHPGRAEGTGGAGLIYCFATD